LQISPYFTLWSNLLVVDFTVIHFMVNEYQ
jgi:hypothetical protein